MNIRKKLVLIVCLVTMVPAGIVGVVAYSLSRGSLGDRIKDEFTDRQKLLELQIASPLSELSINTQAWIDGSIMGAIQTGDRDLRIKNFLLSAKKSYPIIKDLTVLNSQAKLIATTNPADSDLTAPGGLSPKALALRDEYPLDSILKGKTVSRLGTPSQTSYLAVPITNGLKKDGSILGVLLCEIDLTLLDKIVLAVNDGKPEAERVFVMLSSKGSTVLPLKVSPKAITYKDIQGDEDRAVFGFATKTVRGIDYIVSTTAMMNVLPGLAVPLSLTILQPTSIAYASVNSLADTILVLSIVSILFFIGVGLLFAISLSRPIVALQQLSEEIINSKDFSKSILVKSRDELGSLGRSFNSLLRMVQVSQSILEQQSKDLESAVSERTKAIRTILDHVSFGLLICDEKLRVKAGYSKSCARIFKDSREDLEGLSLPELLHLDRREADHFESLYLQIFDSDFLLGDLSVNQIPARFHFSDSSIGLGGSVIHDETGRANAVLFCVADISNLVAAEEENTRNRGLIKMLSNRDSFRQFVADVHVGFSAIYEHFDRNNQSSIRHELHTLKGNMGVFDFVAIAAKIHHLEDEAIIKRPEVVHIEEMFAAFLSEHTELLGLTYGTSEDESFVIPERLVDRIEAQALEAKNADDLQNIFKEFFGLIRLKRARTIFGPLDEAFSKLAARLGKQVRLKIEGGETLVGIELTGVFKSLHHLLRNALDHGIEPPELRYPKEETGSIVMSVANDSQGLKITVADDGQGISREAVEKKALAKGLLTAKALRGMSDSEVFSLIFLEGLTTAGRVTDISGRGVGMGAVKAAVEEAGGTIEIASQVSRGTTFTIFIPNKLRLLAKAS